MPVEHYRPLCGSTGVQYPPMATGDLKQLLFELRDVSRRRDAALLGTAERGDLDDALRAVQNSIRYWSDDETEDDAPERD